jgi:biopolymer transport protein ExbD
MLTIRRTDHETRIEIMPLIDVIFLLLTFFIYSMVMMVRAEVLPVDLHSFASGEPTTVSPAVSITIDHTGALYLDREPIALDAILDRLSALRIADPNTLVYVAAEKFGDQDRLPTFLDLYDLLSRAGLTIKLVGSPEE